MTDYDVAVGGVYDNGSCYLQDYLTIGQERPQLDLQQDWILINCSEDNGVTTLFFCRAKNTSDENDTVVEEGKSIYIIWAYHDTTDVTDMSFPQHTVRGFDNKTLCPGGSTTSSAAGGMTTSSAAGGMTTSSAAGGMTFTSSAAGGMTTSSTAGGMTTSSAAGGMTTSSAAGGMTTSSVAGGMTTSSAAGGMTTSSAAGVMTTSSAAGGMTTSSNAGGMTTSSAAGGMTTSSAAEGMTTSSAAGGASTTIIIINPSSAVGGSGASVTSSPGGGGGGGASVTPSASGGGGGGGGASVTTTASGGGGGGGGMSTTTTQTTATSSSVVVNKTPGPTVALTLKVTTACSGNVQTLNVSLQIDILGIYVKAGFSVKFVKTKSISCNSPLNMALDMSFYSPIPEGKTIQGVFEEALKNGSIRNLTTSNTEATFTFIGATIKYKPKAGQCQQVCCDGAGGEMIVVPECTPVDKCEGILLKEKKEDGHCPGDPKGTCTVECDDDDSGGIHNSPNFAAVVLLAIATFVKTIFY
ncbi:uncharacterized protein LOC144649748 isoform X2 [Oculina patagonica]